MRVAPNRRRRSEALDAKEGDTVRRLAGSGGPPIGGKGTAIELIFPLEAGQLLSAHQVPQAHRSVVGRGESQPPVRGRRYSCDTPPVPGQPLDPAMGPALVEGTIRDVLGVGGTDPLPSRLRAAAA